MVIQAREHTYRTLEAHHDDDHDRAPLPAVTGEAIAAYLKDERPKTSNRAVFVRNVAPQTYVHNL